MIDAATTPPSPGPTAVPPTVRLFVSSTFEDLKAERDLLQERVFPELQRFCAARGVRFQAIDLRWGISPEAALGQRTLEICLQEVRRCRESSAGPSLLVLLGDRYGSRLPPPRIPADRFETILGRLGEEDRRLLARWYHRDDNAVPPEYRLQARSQPAMAAEGAVDRGSPEDRLAGILERAAEDLGLEGAELRPYRASVTEQEIAAGALEVQEPEDRVFCVFREIRLPARWTAGRDGESDGESDVARYVEPDPDARRRLSALKAGLGEHLGAAAIHRERVRWGDGGPQLDAAYVERLAAWTTAALRGAIERRLAALAELPADGGAPLLRPVAADPALRDEVGEQLRFAARRRRHFVGRRDDLEAIAASLRRGGAAPLCIAGGAGLGKSALLAEALAAARRAHPGAVVVARFVGATPRSTDPPALLDSLCREISHRYGADVGDMPVDPLDLAPELARRMARATSGRPLVLFVDGVDQLAAGAGGDRAVDWIPPALPPHVRLVLSARPGAALDRLRRRGVRVHGLAPLPRAEAARLLATWLDAGQPPRQLQRHQSAAVLDAFERSGGQPLYLRLACDEARHWPSGLPAGGADPAEPGCLHASIDGLIEHHVLPRLGAGSAHGGVLVSTVLGYLAAARFGLAEDELLDLLSRDPEVCAWFLEHAHGVPPGPPRLPVVYWSRLWFDLRHALSARSAQGTALLAFHHRELAEVARRSYLSGRRGPELHGRLADLFRLRADPAADGSWSGGEARGLGELPHHLTGAARWRDLRATLTDVRFLERKAASLGVAPLLADFDVALAALERAGSAAADHRRGLPQIRRALRREAPVVAAEPRLLPSHLHNTLCLGTGSGVAEGDEVGEAVLAAARRAADRRCWLRLTNRPPVHREPLLAVLDHGATVWRIAWSPDGDLLASAGADGVVRTWDVAQGTEVARLRPRAGGANAVAWSPDGATLASAHDDGTLRLWDAWTAVERRTVPIADTGVVSVAWSPGGDRLAAGTGEGAVVVVDADRGRGHRIGAHAGPVYAVAWSPEGSWLASCGADAAVRLWQEGRGGFRRVRTLEDRAVLRQLAELLGRGPRVWRRMLWKLHRKLRRRVRLQAAVVSLAWSPDGATLATGSRMAALRFWDPATGTPGDLVLGDWSGVGALAWAPDRRLLAWGSGEGQVFLGSPQERQQAQLPAGHGDAVRDLAFAPDGRTLASCGDDGSVRLWAARALWERAPSMDDPVHQGHRGSVQRAALSADGRLLATADSGSGLVLWDAVTGERVDAVAGLPGPVLALAPCRRGALFSPFGTAVEAVPVFRWRGGDAGPAVAVTTRGPVLALALSPDGRTVASGDVAGTVLLTELGGGQVRGVFLAERALGPLPPGPLPVWGLAWSPDGRFVAAAGRMGVVVWHAGSGTEAQLVLRRPADLPGSTGAGFGDAPTLWIEDHPLAWSPDGGRLASSSADGVVRVWHAGSGEAVAVLEEHGAVVSALDWSPDGRRLASGSHDGTVRVWDVESGRRIAVAHCLSPVLAVRYPVHDAVHDARHDPEHDPDPDAVRAADDGSATGLRPMPYVFQLRGAVADAPPDPQRGAQPAPRATALSSTGR